MSHPTPTDRPSNPENPRVFFDVDIGGERGQKSIWREKLLGANAGVSLVSIAHGGTLMASRNFYDVLPALGNPEGVYLNKPRYLC